MLLKPKVILDNSVFNLSVKNFFDLLSLRDVEEITHILFHSFFLESKIVFKIILKILTLFGYSNCIPVAYVVSIIKHTFFEAKHYNDYKFNDKIWLQTLKSV